MRWLRYAQILAVSTLAALAAAVLAVHLESGRDDDDGAIHRLTGASMYGEYVLRVSGDARSASTP